MPSKTKTITMKFPSIKITFARWYEWYGDTYKSKLDAIEVWNQMTADKEDCTINSVAQEHDDDEILQQVYFDGRTLEAERIIANHQRSKTQSAAVNTSTQ